MSMQELQRYNCWGNKTNEKLGEKIRQKKNEALLSISNIGKEKKLMVIKRKR